MTVGVSARPFRQCKYDQAKIRLAWPINGPAFKFMLLIPVRDKGGNEIFGELEEIEF